MPRTATKPCVSRPISVDTLKHAVETAGSVDGLARRLAVPGTQVKRWMVGLDPVPLEVFMQALDLIAAGPFNPPHQERRRRGMNLVDSAGPAINDSEGSFA